MSETKTNPIIKPAATGQEREEAWKRMEELLERVRSRVPPEITEEEIARDAEEAIQEVRRKRDPRDD